MSASPGVLDEHRIPVQRPGFRYTPAETIPWVGDREYTRSTLQAASLSKTDRSRAVTLTDGDCLTARGAPTGYRSILGTQGVAHGNWYFECVWEGGDEACLRFGVARLGAKMLGPIGADGLGYSLCSDGSVYHNGRKHRYSSQGFQAGDILGCLLSLPPLPVHDQYRHYADSMRGTLIGFHGLYLEQKIPPPPTHHSLPDSVGPGFLEFFINGHSLGAAFIGQLPRGYTYYPAFSLYRDPHLRVNFGPGFLHPCSRAAIRPWCESARLTLVASSLLDLRSILAEWSRQRTRSTEQRQNKT